MTQNQTAMAERLRDARAHAGYAKGSEAADAMGIPKPTYLSHENGSRGFSKEAPRYAEFFHVNLEWLLTGKGQRRAGNTTLAPHRVIGPKMPAVHLANEDFTPIGRFDAAFSMGPGSLVAENPEPLGYHLIETQWLRALTRASVEMLAVVRVYGDSMLPTLVDGDWVLIDRTQTRISREGIYAIQVREDAWVKRLSLNLSDKKVRIISDNTTIPFQDIDEEELSVLGRVISLVARKIS